MNQKELKHQVAIAASIEILVPTPLLTPPFSIGGFGLDCDDNWKKGSYEVLGRVPDMETMELRYGENEVTIETSYAEIQELVLQGLATITSTLKPNE
jgi:hypothetical protein